MITKEINGVIYKVKTFKLPVVDSKSKEVIKMEKKGKEALLGYLNNTMGIYRLYSQDSFSDEDFLSAAVTDWTLDIMEEFILHTDVRPLLKLIRKAVNEGRRISKLPYNDDRETEDIATYDKLMAEAERLKARLNL